MQDNDDKLFDKAFVDRSWSEMQKLLDKEMPVRQHSRRSLWLLALGFLVLTTAGWLFGPTSNLYRPLMSADLPVVDQQLPSTDEWITTTSDSTIVPNKSTNPTHQITPDRLNILQAKKNNNQPKPNNADLTSIPQMNNLTTNNEQLSSPPAPRLRPAGNISYTALAFLKTNNKELQWPLRETPSFFEFKSKVRPTVSNWNWGVQANVLSATVPNANGWSLGVWGQRPRFFSNRLSLRFGLLYQTESRTPYGAGTIDKDVGISAENTDPTVSFPSGRQQDTLDAQAVANLLDLQVRRYQLPLEVQWRATRQLNVIGGMRLSYRQAKVNSQFNDQQNMFTADAYTAPEFSQLLAVDKGNALPEDFIQHWDLGLHLGLSYQFLPRLEAVMSYQYGLNNLFKGVDLELYNRNVSIGLMYRIK